MQKINNTFYTTVHPYNKFNFLFTKIFSFLVIFDNPRKNNLSFKNDKDFANMNFHSETYLKNDVLMLNEV